MAVNWEWKNKMGEVTLTQKYAGGITQKYTVEIFAANCLMALIYRYKDDNGESMYQFITFCNDVAHLKNCLGLNPKEGYSDNIFANYSDWKLNTYFKDSLKIAKELVRTYAMVTLYYEDINATCKESK